MSTPPRKIPIQAQFRNDDSNIIVWLNNTLEVVGQLEIKANQYGRIRLSRVSDISLKNIDKAKVIKSYLKISKLISGGFLPHASKYKHILCKYNLAEEVVTIAVAVNEIAKEDSIWVALEQVVSSFSEFFYENVIFSSFNHISLLSIVCFFIKMLHIHLSITYHCC